MPTAARLVAALMLAATAALVSEMIKPLMPEGMDFGWFTWVNAGLGALCGWVVIGRRAGAGVGAAVGHGLTGLGALLFWAILLQAGYEMLRMSLRSRYGGPVEALEDMVRIAIDHAQFLLTPQLAAVLVAGGVLSGLAAEIANRHWR
jgi:hypothetical protein